MSICEVSQFNRVGIIRIIETRNEHTQRKGYVRTQQYGHLQAKERGLRRPQLCDTLISDFCLQNCEKVSSCGLSPVCSGCGGSPSRLIQS
jgi:hypothetical protein